MLNSDFKEFAQLLNAHRVEYLIVGGYALAAHGHPRYTGDLDIWYRNEAANVAFLHAALQDFGFGSPGITSCDLASENSVFQLGFPPRRIDLLGGIDGVEFSGAWNRREKVEWNGLTLPLIALADFKANKRATGRLKASRSARSHLCEPKRARFSCPGATIPARRVRLPLELRT